MLHNKAAVSCTFRNFSGGVSGVAAIGMDTISYKFAISFLNQLVNIYYRYLFIYCWFMGNSNALIYLKGKLPTGIVIQKMSIGE